MLSGITKVGTKTLIHIDALEALYSKISSLPAKRKTVFELRDAVDFLSPAIFDALGKNYTKDDLFSVFENSGWDISQASWKYIWSLLRSHHENNNKKKNSPKSAPKHRGQSSHEAAIAQEENQFETQVEVQPTLHSDTERNESESLIFTDDVNGTKASESNTNTTEILTTAHKEEPQSVHNAHFNLPPDTEDL